MSTGYVVSAGDVEARPESGTAQAQVTIDLWDQQTGIAADATKKIIADFEAKNPGIKINRTYIAQTEGTQSDQKLLTAIAGGNPPDVYKFDRFIVSQFAAQDFLTELTDLATKGGVKADGRVLSSYDVDTASIAGEVIQAGKRQFLRIRAA